MEYPRTTVLLPVGPPELVVDYRQQGQRTLRLRCVRAQSHHCGAHGGALYLPRTTGGSKTRVVVGGWQRQGGPGAAQSRLLCRASPGSSRSDWRTFDEARAFARSLGLESNEEWRDWSKSKEKPSDIPAGPDRFYKDEGWLSWGDFLGYNEGYVPGGWRDFEEARDFARSLGLESYEEWKEWSKSREKPSDIPAGPDRFYKVEGWLSYGDFLGYGKGYVPGEYLPFEEARGYVWRLGLKSVTEWWEWSKSKEKPQDIPSSPDYLYKDEGWLSWGDFLGYDEGYVPGECLPFEEAREYVWRLGLKSVTEWWEWSKSKEKPQDIPSHPELLYKDEGWLSWGDFLGYDEGYVEGEYRSFEEARGYVWTLDLKSQKEWWEWSKSKEKPQDIPSHPELLYKDEGWLSWPDFLGYKKGHVAKTRTMPKRLSFTDALGYVWNLGLKSHEDWLEFVKSKEKPQDIPSHPELLYKDKGWKSWGDFLGYKEGHVPGDWQNFQEARDYVWTLGLKNNKEWWEWSKSGEKPSDIPAGPDRFYKDEGWLSWGDFLGYTTKDTRRVIGRIFRRRGTMSGPSASRIKRNGGSGAIAGRGLPTSLPTLTNSTRAKGGRAGATSSGSTRDTCRVIGRIFRRRGTMQGASASSQ